MNDLLKQAAQIVSASPKIGRIGLARELGITEARARLLLSKLRSDSGSQGKGPDIRTSNSTVSGDSNHQTVDSMIESVRTLEDLLQHHRVDTKKWKVDHWVANSWDIGAKHPVTGKILTKALFQVKAWLVSREIEKTIEDIQDGFLEKVREAAPKIKTPKNRKRKEDRLLEISIFDLHLGQTSWEPETGYPWGPELAEKQFLEASRSLVQQADQVGFDRILLPIGNDFFNVDNLNRTTTNGTPQDEAVRWQQSFAHGKAMTVKAIEEMAGRCPVDVVIVSGNHDMQRAFYLGSVLEAHFRNSPGVTVNNSPTMRKYVSFGRNLLGFTHGKDEKVAELGLIMAAECPGPWSLADYREWHVGHLHHRRSSEIKTGDESHNVRHRVIPSLCGRDAWHTAKGYLATQAAESFIWRHSGGCEANFSYYPDPV